MTALSLQADCSRCAALCCVVLAFDRGEMFAFDKPACEPCRHLAADGCQVHADRKPLGFRGCIAFDCAGAGQYVTQVMFGGRSWRDDPDLARPMGEAFATMLAVHAQLGHLHQSRSLSLPDEMQQRLCELERALQPAAGWTLEDVRAGRAEKAVAEVRAFLASLRPFVATRS
ncbi:MAG: hypothetical protein HY859_17215 [Caulobacterales bacterium]|nr:hypothetical protein [Caulobacterales bacterium]